MGEARKEFADDHVHALLVVRGARLLAVIERSDLVDTDDDVLAASVGRLTGRVVDPRLDLATAHRLMLERGTRRLPSSGVAAHCSDCSV